MIRSLLLTALVVLSACQKEKLQAALPPDVRVDTYQQTAAGKIDVLWVVDNSGSMAPRQENLAKNFGAFIDTFAASSVDYRIAITTTDMFKDKGRFVGVPSILSPQTPNVLQAFATNVKVGIDGSPYETGFEPARMALERVRAENDAAVQACKGACKASDPGCPSACEENTTFKFLRRGAYLYIVFVSDEDDKSSGDIRYYYRTFATAMGIGNDGTVTTAAIMGDVPTNTCQATPGLRYKALSDLTGGQVGSICDANFASTLHKLADNAVGLRRTFALQDKPNVQTIQVRVRYPCNVSTELLKACASSDTAACAGQPKDSLNVVCTPVQGGTDGWSYEAAKNVVYFAGDSVPGLTAQVELQYYEEGKGP